LWEFNLGIFLAERYINKGEIIWDQHAGILAIIAISGIGIMAIMVLNGGRLGQTFNDIPASIGYFCLAAFTYSIFQKMSKTINSSIIYIGKLSYELYLTHMLVFLLLNELIIKFVVSNSNIYIALFFIFPSSIILARLFMLVMSTIYQKTKKQVTVYLDINNS
jgi:peptidoglycan/LPS O-acetylase OafA/YrhL